MAEPTNNQQAEPTESPETEIQQNQTEQEPVSDTKMLLAPLVKYGIAALLIVGVIITTAIYMNSEFNTIDEQLASVEAEVAQQNHASVDTDVSTAENTAVNEAAVTETAVIEPAVTEAAINEKAVTEAAVSEKAVAETAVVEVVAQVAAQSESVEMAVDNISEEAPGQSPATAVTMESTANDLAVVESATPDKAAAETAAGVTEFTAAEAVESETALSETAQAAPLVATSQFASHDAARKARIAEQHAEIAKQDQEYLESFKSRQVEQIKWLREQLVRQEQRIEQIEKRNQESYEMREANIKRMQQAREESLNRI